MYNIGDEANAAEFLTAQWAALPASKVYKKWVVGPGLFDEARSLYDGVFKYSGRESSAVTF